MKRWSTVSREFDHKIKTLHKQDLDNIEDNGTKHWEAEVGGKLAAILLCDRFSRSCYRYYPNSYAYDQYSLKIANQMIDSGEISKYKIYEQTFIAMPLMHSEDITYSEKLLKFIKNISATSKGLTKVQEAQLDELKKHAEIHKDILAKFGRYPHRNKALGRVSTPEEAEYLKTAETSGQTK